MKNIMLILSLLWSSGIAFSQSARQMNRDGVEKYQAGEFEAAEKSFKKAANQNRQLIEASYNIALTYYRQQKYNEAINQLRNTLSKTSDKELQAKLYHNLGNSYLQTDKLKESIDSYQNSLKLNPNDEETRYNLAFAVAKLKARERNKPNESQKLMDKIEQEENTSQHFMRRNKNRGKQMKNW